MKLLYFTAKWCGPCKRQKPIIENLRSKGYNIETIDIDAHPNRASEYEVMAIPTYIKLDDSGNKVDQHAGLISEKDLENFIRRNNVKGK